MASIVVSLITSALAHLKADFTNKRIRSSSSATAAFVKVTIKISFTEIFFSIINLNTSIATEYVFPVPALASIKFLFSSATSVALKTTGVLFFVDFLAIIKRCSLE